MKVRVKTASGYNIMHSYEIEGIIADKIIQVPGVVKLTGKTYIRKFISQFSNEKSYGLEVDYLRENKIGVRVYVILASGLNINDITNSIQDVVKYTLENSFGLKVKYVDVYVKGIK